MDPHLREPPACADRHQSLAATGGAFSPSRRGRANRAAAAQFASHPWPPLPVEAAMAAPKHPWPPVVIALPPHLLCRRRRQSCAGRAYRRPGPAHGLTTPRCDRSDRSRGHRDGAGPDQRAQHLAGSVAPDRRRDGRFGAVRRGEARLVPAEAKLRSHDCHCAVTDPMHWPAL